MKAVTGEGQSDWGNIKYLSYLGSSAEMEKAGFPDTNCYHLHLINYSKSFLFFKKAKLMLAIFFHQILMQCKFQPYMIIGSKCHIWKWHGNSIDLHDPFLLLLLPFCSSQKQRYLSRSNKIYLLIWWLNFTYLPNRDCAYSSTIKAPPLLYICWLVMHVQRDSVLTALPW